MCMSEAQKRQKEEARAQAMANTVGINATGGRGNEMYPNSAKYDAIDTVGATDAGTKMEYA